MEKTLREPVLRLGRRVARRVTRIHDLAINSDRAIEIPRGFLRIDALLHLLGNGLRVPGYHGQRRRHHKACNPFRRHSFHSSLEREYIADVTELLRPCPFHGFSVFKTWVDWPSARGRVLPDCYGDVLLEVPRRISSTSSGAKGSGLPDIARKSRSSQCAFITPSAEWRPMPSNWCAISCARTCASNAGTRVCSTVRLTRS